MEIETGKDTQLTLQGTENLLVGQVDWVYGEEFSIDVGFSWSPDSRYIAYYQLDQSTVPQFPITDFIPTENEVTNTRYPKAGTQFIWPSNRSGFKHLYLYDIDGKQIRQLTGGNWEVDDLVGVDEENMLAYFRATEKASWERHLYKVDLSGNGFQQLTQGDGWHTISMSPGCRLLHYRHRGSARDRLAEL